MQNRFENSEILLNGYFGSGNAGDEAILDAEVALFNELKANVTVASPKPDRITCSQQIDTVQAITNSPSKWREKARSADHIVIGGGGLITSQRVVNKEYAIIRECCEINTPIHTLGIGITPPVSYLHKKLYKSLFNHVNTVVVRDPNSKQILKSIGVKKSISVCPDFAFYHHRTSLPKKADASSDTLTVVLRRVPWLSVDLNGLAESLHRIHHHTGCNINIVCFDEKAADIEISNDLIRLIDDIPNNMVENLPPHELEKQIKHSRYVIGMRLHSIVFAAKHGVPYLSLAYNPKCEYVPDQFGYHNVNWCYEISPEDVANNVVSGWNNKDLRRNLIDAARSNHRHVQRIPTHIDTSNTNSPPQLKSVHVILQKILEFEQSLRERVGHPRPPTPDSAIPRNAKQLQHPNRFK